MIIFLLRMMEVAEFLFAAIISDSKSEVRSSIQGAEVLSYRNNRGIPSRDEISMLAQFYYTRSKDPTPEITMAQCIGFAYASCGNHRRVYDVLEDIYSYYLNQGYEPNPAGLPAVYGTSPDLPSLPIKLDHFPTISEIQRFFLETDYQNDAQNSRTWPLSHFLYPPCSRP